MTERAIPAPPSRWAARAARWAYGSALRLASPLYLLKLWQRGRQEPLYREAWGERFGCALPAIPAGSLWLHAVSLGETLAAAPLVAALRARRPGLRLLLTHGTATGRQAGQALLRPGDTQLWLPFDTPGAVRRFLRHARPAAGVLMETEIWPNLLHEAARAGVPVWLANARLSEKSARQGHRLHALMRPAAQSLRGALAQSAADAARLRAAGVASVQVCGNLKFDLRPDEGLRERGRAWREDLARPVVAAVNTRDGEEAALLARWQQLPQPRPLLLLVPRHPQRFDDVAALVAAQGLSLSRRSRWAPAGPSLAEHGCDVWLGDSLGEMAQYYGLADLALLGGSFEPLGGHNLIEAAACACPILLGPSTFNFAQAAQGAVEAGAAWQVAGWDEALALGQALLAAPERLQAAAAAARDFASSHRGAADRMAAAILQSLPPA